MASNFTMEEIRKSVQKDDNSRLQKAMQVGQIALDADQISKLTRLQLIEYVTTLRFLVGQTESVKSVVPGFDPKTVKFTSEMAKVAAGEAIKTETEQSALLGAVMMLLKKEENRDRERMEEKMQERERQEKREKELMEERQREQNEKMQERET